MNGHLSAQFIERYRQRAVPPAELLDADDHLAACEICRRRLGDEPRVQAAGRSLRSDLTATGLTHLAYEEMESYVEGALDRTDREIADSHLELCAQCAGEIGELRAFATDMDAYPAREYAPADPPSLGNKLRSFAKSLREGSEAFWRSPALWPPVRLASLGLIIALVLWVAVLNSRNSQLLATLDGARQENEKLKQDYQAASVSVTELQNELAELKSEVLPSSFVVALNDGPGQVTLDKQGDVAGVPPEYQQIVKQTLTAQQIGTPQSLSELIGKSGVLMGPADEGHPIALLSPVGTVALSDRPVFRWRALDGADGYVVKIYDADFNEVAASPQLSRTAWTATRALHRGGTYSWQVIARADGKEVISPVKPAPDARFMVLNQAKSNDLIHAKNAGGNSHLTLGILYAQAGLLDDAEREFQALLRANPQSPLAHKLLRSVREKRQPS